MTYDDVKNQIVVFFQVYVGDMWNNRVKTTMPLNTVSNTGFDFKSYSFNFLN